MPSRTERRQHRPAIAGFTLVEVLIAIGILALMSVMLTPMFLPSPGRTVNQVATDISLRLRELRRESRATHQHHYLLLDTASRRYRSDSASTWQPLPKGMTLELTTADSLLRSDDTGAIDYYPRGSSSGGRIVLGLAGHVARIDVEWLTGRVTVTQSQP